MTIFTKQMMAVVGAALCSLPTLADTKQTVTVNGVEASQSVKQITFNGDQLTLTFADATTQTEDLAKVNIALSYLSTPTAIDRTPAEDAKRIQPVYNLEGQLVGNSLTNLPKGVYLQGGKKVVVK